MFCNTQPTIFRVVGGFLLALLVSGCGADAGGTHAKKNSSHGDQESSSTSIQARYEGSGPINVVCTTGMVADIVRNVGGDHVEVTQLMGEGVDPHMFKPQPGDVSQLAGADAVFYSGLHLEGHLADVFERMQAKKPTFAVTELIEPDQLIQGEEGVADPHVWFDVSLWSKGAELVADALSTFDPPHAKSYADRSKEYRAKLAELDSYCRTRFSEIPKTQRVLVTAHDAFHYMARAYGLEVRAIPRRRTMGMLVRGKPRTTRQAAADSTGENPRAILDVHDVTVAYHRKPVIWDVDLTIHKPRLVGIVGPNGAGKSTLIKAILGLIPMVSGRVSVFGRPINRQRRLVGYVPQRESVDWEFPVNALDAVLMGTYGSLGWLRRPGRKQRRWAYECLDRVGLADFARRQIGQLSGGQQQRVFLARALAQDAQLYFMDEPMAGVDAATEQVIFGLLRELNEQGRTVVAVHHDLRTVQQYFDDVVLLNMRLVASGSVAETFTQENLRKTYGSRLGILDEAGEAMRAQERSA
jgi:manganese/zinc/iron transport system ATP- binding protein